MVGQHFQRCKNRRNQHAPQVFTPIGQHHTGNHWRQVGQRHHLPDMSCSNNDEEVAAERPYHSTQGRQIDAEVKGTQQDIEAQQVHEDIPHILGQSEVIDGLYLRQQGRTGVCRRHLVGRHTSKQGIRPTGTLSRTLQIFRCFLSCSTSCRRVVAIEHTSLDVSGEEVGKRNHYE